MTGQQITPAELYALTPEYVTHDIYCLWGFNYQHIPEIGEHHAYQVSEVNQTTKRIELRVIKEVDYDERRFWRLAAVWFDGRPVMIVQNAGREGDDHSARFITDSGAYGSMVGALMTSIPVLENVVDPVSARGDLHIFYGDALTLTQGARGPIAKDL